MADNKTILKGLTNHSSNAFIPKDEVFNTQPLFGYNKDEYIKGYEILKGYNFNDTIYSVVSKIARTISNDMPWKVRKVNKSNGETEEVKDTELNALLDTPNQYETITEFREKCITYLLLCGSNFMYGSNGKTFKTKGYNSIHVLPSDLVSVEQGTISDPIKSINVSWDLKTDIDKEDVFITKYPSLSADSYFLGQSPLESGYRLMQSSNALTLASKSITENRGVQGILSNGSEQMMLPNDLDDLQKNLNRKLNGNRKDGYGFASGAKLNYLPLELSPNDLKLLETYEANLKRICNLFNIDSKLFNDSSSSTYNNVREATKGAYVNCFIPNDSKILETFNKNISSKYNDSTSFYYEVYHDLSDVDALQEDKNEKAKIVEKQSKEIRAIITDINNGVLSVDAGVLILTDIHGIDEDKAEILAQYGQAKNNGQSEEVQG